MRPALSLWSAAWCWDCIHLKCVQFLGTLLVGATVLDLKTDSISEATKVPLDTGISILATVITIACQRLHLLVQSKRFTPKVSMLLRYAQLLQALPCLPNLFSSITLTSFHYTKKHILENVPSDWQSELSRNRFVNPGNRASFHVCSKHILCRQAGRLMARQRWCMRRATFRPIFTAGEKISAKNCNASDGNPNRGPQRHNAFIKGNENMPSWALISEVHLCT